MTKHKKWTQASGTRAYYAWRSMRYRCTSPRSRSWNRYGRRGITVCKQWAQSYDQFFADMGACPPGFYLDRIDNDKGYYPENCRWVTAKESINNRSNTVKIKGKSLSDISSITGVKYATLHARKKRYKKSEDECVLTGRLSDYKLPEHGSRAMYERIGCRCALCREANAKRARNQRNKNKESTSV